MSDKRRSIPLIAGVSILFLIPIGIGAFSVSYISSEEDGSADTGEATLKQPETDAFGFYDTESAAPAPSSDSGRGGSNPNSATEEGIQIGKYSNPPASVKSGGDIPGSYTRPLDDSGSSIERNKSIQRGLGNPTSEYNPSASYDSSFSGTEDNSLAEPLDDDSLVSPLEDDGFLEVPDSDSGSVPLAPVSEPLSQPDIAR